MNATATNTRRSGGCACGGTCGGCRQQAPPIVHDVLRTQGEPLDRFTRARMESRIGHDFSRVRVHRDEQAARSAAAVSANAYTVGRDIVFGAGNYAPQTDGGSRLLQHELGHVVQQRNAVARPAAIDVGPAEDAAERDGSVSLAAPRLQRSILGGFLDVLLFIPRLFGAGGYPDDDLADYLKGLKKNHAPEDGIFSDNKARGCVDADDEKRLTALGAPYDMEVKRLLVEEMLGGFTSFLDERAILRLLRRQSEDDRQTIVTQIGRPKLWSNFSGGNRRLIEAITLTKDDAKDPALIGRLRQLSPGELQDYRQNIKDPDLLQVVQRAALLHSITAPVPSDAKIEAPPPAPLLKGGPVGTQSAKVTINGVDIYALPDVIDSSLGNKAFTDEVLGGKLPSIEFALTHSDGTENTVDTFRPAVITIHIRTRYGDAQAPSGKPVYGVGTRPGDVPELRTHEGSHGGDWYDYIRKTPPPMFAGKAGMTVSAFDAELKKYEAQVDAWFTAAQKYSIQHTDCVGKLPTDENLADTPYKASICFER